MAEDPWTELLGVLAGLDNNKKYEPFRVIAAVYKSLNQQTPIRAHILLPRSLLDGERNPNGSIPLIVRIHGGYLVGGSSLYPPWFTDWVLELALRHGAAVISPNYRLLPESDGADILQDIDDFWAWLKSGKADSVLHENGCGSLSIDTSRVLVTGESAGGYLAMQLALSYPSEIRSVVGCYPMLEVEDPFYNTAFHKPILGVSSIDLSLPERHLAAVQGNDSRVTPTEASPPDRLALSFAIVQSGRYLEFLGARDSRLSVFRRIEDTSDAGGSDLGASLPRMFLYHGTDDSAVPCTGTMAFMKHMKAHRPKARLRVTLQPGDHGFDFFANLETPWLQKGLIEIVETWLRTG